MVWHIRNDQVVRNLATIVICRSLFTFESIFKVFVLDLILKRKYCDAIINLISMAFLMVMALTVKILPWLCLSLTQCPLDRYLEL